MDIEERITGITEQEINYDFSAAKIRREFLSTTHRNVKVLADLILGPIDLEKEKERENRR